MWIGAIEQLEQDAEPLKLAELINIISNVPDE